MLLKDFSLIQEMADAQKHLDDVMYEGLEKSMPSQKMNNEFILIKIGELFSTIHECHNQDEYWMTFGKLVDLWGIVLRTIRGRKTHNVQKWMLGKYLTIGWINNYSNSELYEQATYIVNFDTKHKMKYLIQLTEELGYSIEDIHKRFMENAEIKRLEYDVKKNDRNKFRIGEILTTSTEMIKDMLERQKAYDEEVFKKHNVDYVSKTQLESALFDELGELMHAQKSDWCWWKFTQEPKDPAKVFEEYIDVVHFALMYEIKFGSGCYQYEDIKWNYNKLKTDLGFGQAYAFSCVISLTRDDNVLAYVIALGLHLGYSFGEIYNEYIRKNEINKERLVKGY